MAVLAVPAWHMTAQPACRSGEEQQTPFAYQWLQRRLDHGEMPSTISSGPAFFSKVRSFIDSAHQMDIIMDELFDAASKVGAISTSNTISTIGTISTISTISTIGPSSLKLRSRVVAICCNLAKASLG